MDFINFAAKCIEDSTTGEEFLAKLKEGKDALKAWFEKQADFTPSDDELDALLKHKESLLKLDGPLKGY